MFNISQFITDTYYVLTAPDPCDEISIAVSGYNGAGMDTRILYHHYTFHQVIIKGHSRSPWPQKNVHNFSLE